VGVPGADAALHRALILVEGRSWAPETLRGTIVWMSRDSRGDIQGAKPLAREAGEGCAGEDAWCPVRAETSGFGSTGRA
jgi:hypothetical protein